MENQVTFETRDGRIVLIDDHGNEITNVIDIKVSASSDAETTVTATFVCGAYGRVNEPANKK